MNKTVIFLLLAVFALASCTPTPTNVRTSNALPPVYPDYADITIPVNIAPLNFLVRGAEAVSVVAAGMTVSSRGEEVTFTEREWRRLLEQNKEITVTVTALMNGQWTQYKPFSWHVVADRLDPYLTYRLIEPDYEVFSHLSLQERCIENFDERPICHHEQVGNRCMNCHAYASQNPNLSMLYVRGEGGGAILNRDGQLHKLNLKTPDMASGSVYYSFSPNGPANGSRCMMPCRMCMWPTCKKTASLPRRCSPTARLSRPFPLLPPTASASISVPRRASVCQDS